MVRVMWISLLEPIVAFTDAESNSFVESLPAVAVISRNYCSNYSGMYFTLSKLAN